MWSIIIGLTCSKVIVVSVRLYWGRILLGFGFRYWVRTVLLPISMILSMMLLGGLCVRMLMHESFSRIVVTVCTCEAILIPGCWFMVLNNTEKTFVRQKILSRFRLETK